MDCRGNRFVDLTDQVFGRLSVVGLIGKIEGKALWWKVMCQCGKEMKLCCGAVIKRRGARPCRHKKKHTDRWNNLKVKTFKVCERWLNSYDDFAGDIGDQPAGKPYLCPVDHNKPFGPGNFLWATKSSACASRRGTLLTIDGVTKRLCEWIREAGARPSTVTMRLAMGWSAKDAVFAPRKPAGRKPSKLNLTSPLP